MSTTRNHLPWRRAPLRSPATLLAALSISLAGCDGGASSEGMPARPSAPATVSAVNVKSTAPLASCYWKDIKPVMQSIEPAAGEGVCETMRVTLGRMPSIALTHKLSQLIFIIRVGDELHGPDPKALAQQIMDVVEARGLQDDDAGIDETFETLAKIYSASDGRVTSRDMNINLRAAGPLAKTMNQDGLFGVAAMLEVEKKNAGD